MTVRIFGAPLEQRGQKESPQYPGDQVKGRLDQDRPPVRYQRQSRHCRPYVNRKANQDDQNEYDCSPAHGSEIALSDLGAKLPSEESAITQWCAARGFRVLVQEKVGDGALNVHWLLNTEAPDRRLIFRQRGTGHWLQRGFVGEALAQGLARKAGVLAPAVHYADRFGMLVDFAEGSADREAVIGLAGRSSEFREKVIEQLARLQSQTSFHFKGEDGSSWLKMAIGDYCLANTPWFAKLQRPEQAERVMGKVHELGFDALCLSHGDFRTGNLLVQDGTLTGLLDWEFAAYRPIEADVGWLVSSPWRYSRPDLEASGLMSKEAVLKALKMTDSQRLRGWEALALVRWCVIARLQDERQGKPAGSNADETALLTEALDLVAD